MAAFMQRLRQSRIYPQILRALRVIQFLSALASIVVFSLRVRKLINLYNGINRATGAVEGILAAALLYTLVATALTFLLKGRGGSGLRWVLVALDIAFVGAFIAVAVLTSPRNGSGGLGCYGERKRIASENNFVDDPYCQLPLGTFITAIISTVLHTLTAIFHSLRDRHNEHNQSTHAVKEGYAGKISQSDNDPIDGTHHVGTYHESPDHVVGGNTGINSGAPIADRNIHNTAV